MLKTDKGSEALLHDGGITKIQVLRQIRRSTFGGNWKWTSLTIIVLGDE